MNATLATLLGLTLAQAPAPDYYALSSKNIKLPISYTKDRAGIRQVLLYVSTDQGNVWNQVAEQPPNGDSFLYSAPKDGLYWFHIVTVDLKGQRDPANMTREPPAQKALVDTTAPQVRFTNARRTGDDVVIEWVVEDAHPAEAETRVYFRPAEAGDTGWKEVSLPAGSRTGVRFAPGTPGAVVVKVMVQDLAGNKNEGQRDIPAPGAPQQTTSLSPANPSAPTAALPPPNNIIPPGPVAPAELGAPAGPIAVAPPTPSQPVVSQQPTGPTPSAVFQGPQTPPAAAAQPWTAPTDPRNQATPTAYTGNSGGSAAVVVFSGPSNPPPTVEVTRTQAINFLRFDLSYQVEQQGSSGVSRVDLWLTRDDGQTWGKWSEHAGRDAVVRVNLEHRGNAPNTQPEGRYGFRLIPVSGAGLSDRAPAPGDAPDIRAVVDLTSPRIEWYEPVPDPHAPDTLVIRWQATDQNFGDAPITLEWSENRTGPWQPIAVGGDGVIPASGPGGPAVRRLPNTGWHKWRVPMGVPPRVYVKVTATDAAGNFTEGVTPTPILVDLAKPKARIQGIVSAPHQARP